MTALARSVGLTAEELLAMMPAGERATLIARLARADVKNKDYLELPLGREVGRYLRAKRKTLTPSSYIGYESTLHKLVMQFPDLALEDFENPAGGEIVEEWMDARWGRRAPGTYNVCLAHLTDFFKWQVRQGRLNSNPCDLIDRARTRETFRETFSDDQRKAALAQAGGRDGIALRLLFDYALRKNALRGIQFKHFDHEHRELSVLTKQQKVRCMPIVDEGLWMDLERLILDWEAQPSHYLMCVIKPVPYGTPTRDGRRPTRLHRFPDRQMSNTALHRWWYRQMENAGIVPKGDTAGAHMHKARHTAAQRMLESEHDLYAVKDFLGHSSIQTTEMYAEWNNFHLAESLRRMLKKDDDA